MSEHIAMHTIRNHIATTHVHFNLAVYQVVTITVCEVDGHGWRVVCSCVCPAVVVVFGGGDDVFVCLLRERPVTNSLGVAVLSCVYFRAGLNRGDCANQ